PSLGESCIGMCDGDLICASDGTQTTCVAAPASGEPCLGQLNVMRCAEGLACIDDVCGDPPGEGEACLNNSLTPCAEGLVCGGALCSQKPDSPGCDECDDPDFGVVTVCQQPPPAVCADSGGLLF